MKMVIVGELVFVLKKRNVRLGKNRLRWIQLEWIKYCQGLSMDSPALQGICFASREKNLVLLEPWLKAWKRKSPSQAAPAFRPSPRAL